MGKHEPAQLTASTAVYLLVREKSKTTVARLDIWIFKEPLQQYNTVQSLIYSSASDKYWEADISKPRCSSLSLWRKSPVLFRHSKLNWRAPVNALNNARFVIMYTCREGVAYPHTYRPSNLHGLIAWKMENIILSYCNQWTTAGRGCEVWECYFRVSESYLLHRRRDFLCGRLFSHFTYISEQNDKSWEWNSLVPAFCHLNGT